MAGSSQPMFLPRPTRLAQMILRESVREGDVVIDATCGNGHDTAFLAECVGATGRVLAFDIQENAIISSQSNVGSAGLDARVEFNHCSHATLAEHVEAASVSAVMFNLGYLPGENHDLTTVASETLDAINAAVHVLKSNGLLSVVCYPGHEAGSEESRRVEERISRLTEEGWRVSKYSMLGTRKPAPFLLIACKQ